MGFFFKQIKRERTEKMSPFCNWKYRNTEYLDQKLTGCSILRPNHPTSSDLSQSCLFFLLAKRITASGNELSPYRCRRMHAWWAAQEAGLWLKTPQQKKQCCRSWADKDLLLKGKVQTTIRVRVTVETRATEERRNARKERADQNEKGQRV